jgi:hypothetical protein
MSNIGVHDFEIPHDLVQPLRDMVVIRLPFPPRKIGSFIMPDVVRDLAVHNVQAGRIVSMGPMAFTYKDGSGTGGNGVTKQKVEIGDWVVIRPYAGTSLQGGKITVATGWRYVSSYSDILAVVPADQMPDEADLIWTEKDAEAVEAQYAAELQQVAASKLPDGIPENVRERVTYKR